MPSIDSLGATALARKNIDSANQNTQQNLALWFPCGCSESQEGGHVFCIDDQLVEHCKGKNGKSQ